MSEATKKQGASDANQGKGQKNPNEFKNDQDRKDYQGGWNNAKKGK